MNNEQYYTVGEYSFTRMQLRELHNLVLEGHNDLAADMFTLFQSNKLELDEQRKRNSEIEYARQEGHREETMRKDD